MEGAVEKNEAEREDCQVSSWEHPEFRALTAARFHAVYGKGWRAWCAGRYKSPMRIQAAEGTLESKMVLLCRTVWYGNLEKDVYGDLSTAWETFENTDGVRKEGWAFGYTADRQNLQGLYDDGQESFRILGGSMAAVVCHAIIYSVWRLVREE